MTFLKPAKYFQRNHQNAPQLTFLLWGIPLLFLLVFFFYPLGSIFRLAAETAFQKGFSISYGTRIWRSLAFTFWQAALSTVLTFLVGMPAAYLFARFRFRGKNILRVLTTLPFIMPTVVVAASFNSMLGPQGILNVQLMRWFGFSTPPIQILNTLGAILLAHVFYNTPVVIRVVGSAWSQLDDRMEKAARVLGASPLRAFFEITLPLLLRPVLSAAFLIFLFDFTSFGVILLLGGPQFATLEVEIYIQAMQMLNLPLAGLLSALQMGFTLILTLISSQINGHQSIPLVPRLRGEGVRRAKYLGEKVFVSTMIGVLVILEIFPLISLVLRSVTRITAVRGERGNVIPGFTLAYYQELFINRRSSLFYVPPIEAMRNSLIYAGLTVIISLTLGFLVTYAMRRRSRFSSGMDVILMLPLGTSAVTLGLGFIVVFNAPPIDVRSFPLLMPIAHSLVALPFVVRTLQPALASIPSNLRQAASVLGASSFQVWREVELPIMARAALVSAIFSFTISLGEFGATTFLARPETPTMPVAIYRFVSQPGALNYGQAMAMSTLLMLVCTVGILVMERLQTGQKRSF